MWQGFEAFVWLRDAYQLKQLQGALRGGLAGEPLVNAQHFIDLFFNVVQRVERGHRLLKYHCDAIAADVPQFFFVRAQ